MTDQQQETIKQILQDILSHMGITAEITTETGEPVVFNLKTEDSGMLIGSHGQSLSALQYIAKLLAYKKLNESSWVSVDVEG